MSSLITIPEIPGYRFEETMMGGIDVYLPDGGTLYVTGFGTSCKSEFAALLQAAATPVQPNLVRLDCTITGDLPDEDELDAGG